VRATQLIDSAAFGPYAASGVCEAFDGAWAKIAGHFGTIPKTSTTPVTSWRPR
jgi:hypothetical protein